MVRLGFESAFEWYSFLSAADLAEYTRSKHGVLQLNIKYQEWIDFLKKGDQYGLCKELFTFRKYRLDLASFADGKKQDEPRDEFYALRIWHKGDYHVDKFTDQVCAHVF